MKNLKTKTTAMVADLNATSVAQDAFINWSWGAMPNDVQKKFKAANNAARKFGNVVLFWPDDRKFTITKKVQFCTALSSQYKGAIAILVELPHLPGA